MKQSPIWFWDLHNYLTTDPAGTCTYHWFSYAGYHQRVSNTYQQLPYGPN